MKRAITTLGVLGLAALAVAAPAVADRGGDDDGGSGSDDKIIICHAGSGSNSGSFTVNSVAVPSLNGHDHHGKDIIPPNDGMKYGQNWDNAGRAIYANGCVVSVYVPPVENPPVDNPPVENPPAENPPVEYPPVENPPLDNPPVENPPAENPPVVPPVVVDPPAVVPPVSNQPVVNPPAGAPAANQSTVVPPSAVQPRADLPQAAAVVHGTNQGYNAQTAVGGSDGAPSWLAGMGALLAAGGAVAFRRKSRTLPLAD